MGKLLFFAASRPLTCLAPQPPIVSGKLGKWTVTIPLGYLFGHSFKKELADMCTIFHSISFDGRAPTPQVLSQSVRGEIPF